MKGLSTAVFIVAIMASLAFAQASEINIVPKPRHVVLGDGQFVLSRTTCIVATNKAYRQTAAILNEDLFKEHGFKLRVVDKPQSTDAIIIEGPVLWDLFEPFGAYLLRVSKDSVRINAGASGRFHAVQSLLQLLSTQVDGQVSIKAIKIDDAPRFPYRGMHLDVGRHFMPVEFVKKYIDLMSQYKFNYFHWHLTEDQGWRIEIKKYPKLTKIGSKRPETQLGAYTTTFHGDGVPHGGFYTQKQIRDIVAYAKARYITVIPEIEMPGHSSAALAAYPELGCRQDYTYKVQMTWGIFKEVYCPTEKTFKFLEDVISEVVDLFPDSPYIHIGGDEVIKDMWKESPDVKALMARENLKDEHDVQSYFVRRMEKFINSKGKRIIGWDEILEGGLAPNAVVMSWRGMKGGIDAARAGHDVIMTPTDYSYFDYRQSNAAAEPVGQSAYLPLEKVYSFDPMPKELSPDEARYILGGQGNVWTEYMKTPAAVEYMAFPRMLAMAEDVWSTPENKNYLDFRRRLAAHLPRLAKQKVNYRDPGPVAP